MLYPYHGKETAHTRNQSDKALPYPAIARRIGRLHVRRLVEAIHAVHSETAAQASRAVNLSLTLRNWLIGCYIDAYELRGKDRATYGQKLLDSLAMELCRLKVSNSNRRQLYRYLRFYRTYPDIVGTLSPQFRRSFPRAFPLERQKWGRRPHYPRFPPKPC